MKHSLAILLLISSMAAPAFAGGDGDGAGFEVGNSFYAPSHNIYCNYYDAGGEAGSTIHDKDSEIHCAILKPKPTVVVLTGRGKVTVSHPGKADMESVYAGKEGVLAYGQSSTDGIHVCTSMRTGMKCTVNGKGFLLSKSGIKKI